MGASRHRLRKVLVIGEFALALALLTGAGLAIHSFWNLTRVDLGVNTENVQTFFLPVPDARPKDPAQITGYYRQMLASIQSVPGVISVCGIDRCAASRKRLWDAIYHRRPTGLRRSFTTAGRGFGMVDARLLQDLRHSGYARPILHRSGQRRIRCAWPWSMRSSSTKYFKGKDPLQQRINVEELIPGVTKLGPPIPWQIVGVFNNVRAGGFRRGLIQRSQIPFGQIPWPSATIGVRTAGDPGTMFRSIAAAVHAVDPQIALAEPRTLDQVKSLVLADDRFIMSLFAAFAGIALLLAAVGIYGVMAFTVAQREHELGLRMALGASRGRVVNLVLKEALMLALIGLGIGLIGAYFVGRAMQSMLFGVGKLDFGAIAAVALVLLGASLVASWLPARRAAAVEPMRALRTE